MNPLNETLADPEVMKRLRESGLDSGYVPVPKELEARAKQLLERTGGLATMDADFKRRLRNRRKKQRQKLSTARALQPRKEVGKA